MSQRTTFQKIYTVMLFTALLIALGLGFYSPAKRVFMSYRTNLRKALDTPVQSAEINPDDPIEYVDKIKPIIEIEQISGSSTDSNVDLMIYSSKKLASPESLEFIEKNESYKYKYRISGLDYGYNDIAIEFIDFAGNRKSETASIFNTNSSTYVIAPFPNAKLIADGNNILSPVSKQYRLSRDYEPEDLAYLGSSGIPSLSSSHRLRTEALSALKKMYIDMQKLGLNITITSAYRSYHDQEVTYIYWTNYNGGSTAAADTISARPGHSEHQLGTVVDIVNSETDYKLSKEFDETQAGKWLMQNAYKYGFALSYPENSESITGYTYEPWHWRYIGVGEAADFHKSGLTLFEYLSNQYLEKI